MSHWHEPENDDAKGSSSPILAPEVSAAGKSSTGRFQVVEPVERRKDLERRREVKFMFRATELREVRALLQSELSRLIHSKNDSTVQSLYFDSPMLSAYHDGLSGISQRQKVRLRWYDSSLPTNDFFLELKWKSNRTTGKHRLQLRSDVAAGGMSYRELRKELLRVSPEGFQRPLEFYSEPIVIVSYRREHFVSRDRSMRLTLDRDLRFFDQRGRAAPNARFPMSCDDLVVLEGKTQFGDEKRLRTLLEPLAARVQRCSKYLHACQLLGASSNVE